MSNKKTKIIIYEGYERVGKTRLVRQLVDEGWNLAQPMDLMATDRIIQVVPTYYDPLEIKVSEDQRWIIGKSILDFLNQPKFSKVSGVDVVVFDRSLVTSIVYSWMYHQSNGFSSSDSPKRVRDYFQSLENLQFQHVYIEHSDIESACQFYDYCESARKSEDIAESYENFRTFEQYWNDYQTADKYFKEVLSIVQPDYTTYCSRFSSSR